ncbi:MAG: hypothetical protein Tsb008_18370 [Rhodothalassiaceae bacterium]
MLEAKELVPARRWIAWIEANLPYDPSSCRRLMQTVRGCTPETMARIRDEIGPLVDEALKGA